MTNIVDIIHKEFDTAVDKLLCISEELKKRATSIDILEEDELVNDGKFLSQIGFGNVNVAKHAENFLEENKSIENEKSSLENKSTSISQDVQFYANLFPFHKFILHSQVLQILEKYNLSIGYSELYKGSIPQKNIDEIKDFMKHIERAQERHSRLYTSLYREEFMFDVNLREPLCAQDTYHDRTNFPKFYICAPKKDFVSGSNIHHVGREIFKNNDYTHSSMLQKLRETRQKRIEDPIILLPVGTSLNQVGFIVVTKWGPEGEDPMLRVSKNN